MKNRGQDDVPTISQTREAYLFVFKDELTVYIIFDTTTKKRNMEDLDAAIQQFLEFVRLTPDDHPERVGRLENLGLGYHGRFLRQGTEADLDAAIQQYLECIRLTPDDHSERAGRLQSLGLGYQDRYRRKKTEVEGDLDAAIQQFLESIRLTSDDHSERAGRLQSLGLGYRDRFERKGTEADLDAAIQQFLESIRLTPDDHSERADRFESLGLGYHDRFERKGIEADLDAAIQQYLECIRLTSDDHSERAGRLQSLGLGYRSRYGRKRAEVDLDTAIQQFLESIRLTSDDHPERACRFESLGLGYRDRYLIKGTEADLDAAIQQLLESIRLTSDNHPDRAGRLGSLGHGYRDRYLRRGVKVDLDAAIQQFLESIRLTPDDHPERANRLHWLGLGYRNRGTEADLDAAIQQFLESIRLTSDDHPQRARRFESLGLGYRDRYLIKGTEADLDAAIQQLLESIRLTPDDHPERAGRLESLGLGYLDRFQKKGIEADLNAAIPKFQESLDHHTSHTLDRLRSGVLLTRLYAEDEDWLLAHRTASTTVSLIALLTTRSLETSDRQNLLTEVAGLASDAAAITLMVSKSPYEAIQLLELGRGIIAASLNELRADVFDLQQKHPQLAEDYISLRDQLDAPTAMTHRSDELDLSAEVTRRVDQRHNTGQKLEQMIGDIRRLRGFERFLLAPTENELRAAAASGPVVVINVSDYRCDALLVEQHQIRSLALTRLNSEEIKEKTKRGDLGTTEILVWLWDVIAQPTLNTLRFTQPPSGDSWPHVWWIPTGLLTKFPLHAAGLHGENSTQTVLDRVISSYSSSIRAIVHGRSRRISEITQWAHPQALLVAMQDTPRYNSLAFATNEVAMVHRLCKSMAIHPVEPGQCKQDIMSHLPSCKILHFAGHGLTDSSDPSQSRLLLKDWETDRFTVANLMEMNLQKHSPFLAYLSACGTGQLHDTRFVDESIHLISAFQLAGFRHVIGTLWEVDDDLSQDMARLTYEGMRDKGMTNESVCWGLHKATRELRDRWLIVSRRAKDTRRSAQEARFKHEGGTARTGDEKEGNARMPWKAKHTSNKKMPWVPYVHFGV